MALDRGQLGPTPAGGQRARLSLVLVITITLLALEIVGGIVAHSLVLIADAGHMATDAAGLGLSLLAVWVARRPASDSRTFGYQRVEILAAVTNAVLLFGVGAYILVEAARRLADPQTASPGLIVVFGVLALVGNGVSLGLLRSGQGTSLNLRGAFLEVLSDLLGAAAILVAAAVIATTAFQRADAIAAVGIGVLILVRTVKLLRDAIDVLLEATPKSIDLTEVRGHICDVPGVLDLHDLHAWTITSGIPVLSAHVVIADAVLASGGGAAVLDRLAECLAGHFDIEHCTFQLEPASHRDHEHATHS
ncbi:MAG: cation diffusion facilitator family transporter [Candidatus Dormibacteria bacterium]